MKNVVWHTFASALSIKFVFTFSPKITFFSTTFFLCNEKFEMLLVEWNRNNHSKEQATSILIRNFFIWNMFSLFPANGNISIWAIYNETYFSFSDKWSKLCILFLTSEFFTLDVRSIVPTLLLILRHWMSIVVQNSFYLSIYFSLYHPLGMIFYWMRKKNHTTTKNTDQLQPYFTILHDESIFQEILYWQKTYFSLYKIFMSAPLPCNFFVILLPHDFNFWHLIIF